MNAPVWQSWDGRRLRWRLQADSTGTHDIALHLDGVVFDRRRAAATGEVDFALAPAGRAEMLLSLHAGDTVLAPPWRVHHGRAAQPGADQWHGPPPPLRALPASAPPPLAGLPGVVIVVAIHNSAHLVRACIESVLRWSRGPVQLILIDDASDEAAITPLLAGYAQRAHCRVLRNPANLGYTRTCNIGIELAGDADVVLLNADTEVGPRWLDRLRQIAHAHDAVGTVTAVSDNAGAFSVPELEQFCPPPSCWNLAQTQRALLHGAGGILPELPSGNGFCLYIKRRVIERIGLLDAEAFPQGYGEENDFCQRAEQAGFHHAIAGDVFVRHERSASFGAARRTALGVTGMAVLRERYPDYERKVGATLFSFERRVLDYRVRRLYADAPQAPLPRARVLLAGDRTGEGASGGVSNRGADLAQAIAAECEAFVLAIEDGRWRLHRFDTPASPLLEETQDLPAIDATLRAWLVRYAIELVHPLGPADPYLLAAATNAGIPVLDTSVHTQTAGPALLTAYRATWENGRSFAPAQ